MFHVGQRVVLVGWRQEGVNAWKTHFPSAIYPEVGEVYTVRAVKPWKDSAVLLLSEINNSHLGEVFEPGFRQEFFRPVVQPKSKTSTGAHALADISGDIEDGNCLAAAATLLARFPLPPKAPT